MYTDHLTESTFESTVKGGDVRHFNLLFNFLILFLYFLLEVSSFCRSVISVLVSIAFLVVHFHFSTSFRPNSLLLFCVSVNTCGACFCCFCYCCCSQGMLVKYYVRWCGHCRAMGGEWDKAARVVEKLQPPIRMYQVRSTCAMNNIHILCVCLSVRSLDRSLCQRVCVFLPPSELLC